MQLKKIFFGAVLIVLCASSAFAAKANHTSAAGVAASLIQSIKNNDFECFNDALSPQSRALVATQQEPQKLFADFSKSIRKALEQVPEEQRPLVSMMLNGQFQRLAQKIDGKWYIDAAALMGSVQ